MTNFIKSKDVVKELRKIKAKKPDQIVQVCLWMDEVITDILEFEVSDHIRSQNHPTTFLKNFLEFNAAELFTIEEVSGVF